jgi:hypothetical protein
MCVTAEIMTLPGYSVPLAAHSLVGGENRVRPGRGSVLLGAARCMQKVMNRELNNHRERVTVFIRKG